MLALLSQGIPRHAPTPEKGEEAHSFLRGRAEVHIWNDAQFVAMHPL